MSKPRKPKAVFTYCFQVWITGIVLAPTISFFWAGRHLVGEGSWWGYEIFMIIYAFLFSVPALLVFSACAAVLFMLGWPIYVNRLVLALFGTFLTMATFAVVFQAAFTIHVGDYPGSMCYVLPSVAGVWLYRWPGRMK